MASTINATTSGIVTIGDSVATLSLQTGGNTAVAIDTAQIVSLSKSLALLGSTSGSVTIAAPAVAGTTTLTLPATSGTLLQSGTAVTVAQGGTGITSGTSGGIPYYSGTSAITSSALLTQYGAVYGGGAGGAPASTAAGTTGQFLGANTGAAPTWQTPAGGSPGGSTTQVQYNNAGAFGGVSGFTTDGTRVTASTTIGVGGATPSTSGSGVTFPATQSASSDVNTLDDYEEGSWTAALTCGTSGTITLDPGYSTLRYTKVGRSVTLTGFVYISAVSSPTGTLTLTGLPFASASGNGFNAGASFYIYGMSTATNLIGVINNSTATVSLETFSAGVRASNIANLFGAAGGFMLSISYFTS